MSKKEVTRKSVAKFFNVPVTRVDQLVLYGLGVDHRNPNVDHEKRVQFVLENLSTDIDYYTRTY